MPTTFRFKGDSSVLSFGYLRAFFAVSWVRLAVFMESLRSVPPVTPPPDVLPMPPGANWREIVTYAPLILVVLVVSLQQAALARRGFIAVDDAGIQWRDAWGRIRSLPWAGATRVTVDGLAAWAEGTHGDKPRWVTLGVEVKDARELTRLVLLHARRHDHIDVGLPGPYRLCPRRTRRGTNIAAFSIAQGLAAWRFAGHMVGGWLILAICAGSVVLMDLWWRCFGQMEEPLAKRMICGWNGASLGLPLWMLGLVVLAMALTVGAGLG